MPRSVHSRPEFQEFFAGSGLVSYALRPYFKAVWANDIDEKKAAVYVANHDGKHFRRDAIERVKGSEVPPAVLSWASFPCQDLSLAGSITGIHAQRSGLVWEWLRVLDEMLIKPPLLVAENVIGLISAEGGAYYHALHKALRARRYMVGAIVLDAIHWVPQSRPRVFVIAVSESLRIPRKLYDYGPNWLHPRAVINAADRLDGWVWWRMSEPPRRQQDLKDIVDWTAPFDAPRKVAHNIKLIPLNHKCQLDSYDKCVAPGYKRTRSRGQSLELRFDGVAGCLRTPQGGSSRQFLVIKNNGFTATRLLTVRETARLMGAPESYKIPGSYNDGYKAMGDAVAVPVARYLAKNLLSPLAKALNV